MDRGHRAAEETSEGVVEDIANQKNFKLAQKHYKIKRQVYE
jgi:sulfur relay (sulfurtransferase) DsrC/TusE family protein